MFSIGWTEMLVVACVAILVVGPKDLPKMLRAFGKTVSSVKKLAGDFQKQFDDALKEAELDEVKDLATGKAFSPFDDIKSSAEAFKKDVKSQMDAATKSVNDGLPKESAVEDGLPKPKEVLETALKSNAEAKTKTAAKAPARKTAKKSASARAKTAPKKTASKPAAKNAAAPKTVAKKTTQKKAAKPAKTA